MSGQAITLEDLVARFQSASESLERSYCELQGRVQSLTAAPEWIPVRQLLEGIRVFLQPMAEQKQIHIVTDCDTESYVVADQLIYRMLLNFVLNAIRETPMDGVVRLSGQVAGSDVLIAVEDTGPGIQEERKARIFDPMFSGNGTRFVISLPQNMEVLSEPVASF